MVVLSIFDFINLIFMIIVLIVGIYSYIKTGRGKSQFGVAIRDFYVSPSNISLPEKMKLERGYATLTILSRDTTPSVVKFMVNWRGLKQYIETDRVVLSDVCFSPPIILRRGELRMAVLPGYQVTRGKYSGVIITCVDTRIRSVKAQSQLVYDLGHVTASLVYSRGTVETSIEWYRVAIGDTRSISERVRIDVCTEVANKTICDVVAELKQPGIIELRREYPETTRLFILHQAILEQRELVDTLKALPEVFIPREPQLKITVTRGYRKIAETPIVKQV